MLLAPRPRRPQQVQAVPGEDGGEPAAGPLDRRLVGLLPAKERLLHRILGVRHRAEQAVGDAEEAPPLSLCQLRRPGWAPSTAVSSRLTVRGPCRRCALGSRTPCRSRDLRARPAAARWAPSPPSSRGGTWAGRAARRPA